jgi:hypothetical protein
MINQDGIYNGIMEAGKTFKPTILLVIFLVASFWPSVSSLFSNSSCGNECCASPLVLLDGAQTEGQSCCSMDTYFTDSEDAKGNDPHHCQCHFCLHCQKCFLPFGYSWQLSLKAICQDSDLPPVATSIFSAFLFSVWHPPLVD